jgi:hypothetical protein
MVDIGTKEQWDAYIEGYRRFNEWEEEHWREWSLPPQEALELISGVYRSLSPEAIARAENPDWTGFSRLMKTWSLIRA